MKATEKELQKIKGIGEVLARRLVEAGHDSYAKVAALGEEGLKAIKGINPRAVSSIIAQATDLAKQGKADRAKRVEELKAAATTLRDQVEGIARSAKERFGEELQGKTGKKLEKELLKMAAALARTETKLESRVKRAGKGLAKAEKRLAGLTEEGLKGVGKGLRRARKSLKRIVAK